MPTLPELEEQLNELTTNSGTFSPMSLADLRQKCDWAAIIAANLHKVKWTVCDQLDPASGIVLIKVETDFIKYVAIAEEGRIEGIDRDVYFWSKGPDFKDDNCIRPHVATAYLVNYETGRNVRCVKEDGGPEIWTIR